MDAIANRPDFWTRPHLHNEARLASPETQAPLTERYLAPALAGIECCLLEVRALVDKLMQPQMPVKLGKPYPQGQCLEIAIAVQKRLRSVEAWQLSSLAAAGLQALRAFLRAGGIFRLVWGALREQYFQNAFQLGTLYVDVANDTVVPTKPKVEILPFAKAQFVPIRDYEHFGRIALSYWKGEIYPNHILPALAPHCPVIHVNALGLAQVFCSSDYMLQLNYQHAFAPAETVLAHPPMPSGQFEHLRTLLKDAGHLLPSSPEAGRRMALQNCHRYRAKRWHQIPAMGHNVARTNRDLNDYLVRQHLKHQPKEPTMTTIRIDGVDYDSNQLSDEAKSQLQMLQLADQEISRLNVQLALAQTARNSYANAVQFLLKQPGKTAA